MSRDPDSRARWLPAMKTVAVAFAVGVATVACCFPLGTLSQLLPIALTLPAVVTGVAIVLLVLAIDHFRLRSSSTIPARVVIAGFALVLGQACTLLASAYAEHMLVTRA